MKADPRIVLFTLLLGVGATTTMVLLALNMPMEGFLVLIFPSFFLWILIPFLVLYLWRRLLGRRRAG
ncbi:MAG: hypothetical protein LN412_05280 [Candidatus Thermoplasmatota archaeon]|nr:hypothetical protein [Candidatus Thermoplasmatota archaeon]